VFTFSWEQGHLALVDATRAEHPRLMEIENLIRYTPRAVELMEIEK
jgi:hypothetical protein